MYEICSEEKNPCMNSSSWQIVACDKRLAVIVVELCVLLLLSSVFQKENFRSTNDWRYGYFFLVWMRRQQERKVIRVPFYFFTNDKMRLSSCCGQSLKLLARGQVFFSLSLPLAVIRKYQKGLVLCAKKDHLLCNWGGLFLKREKERSPWHTLSESRYI